MKKLHVVLLLVASMALQPIGAAIADYAYRDGGGVLQTIYSFSCGVVNNLPRICPGQVPMDSTGVEKATSSNPLRVDPTGATPQPIVASGSTGLDFSANALAIPFDPTFATLTIVPAGSRALVSVQNQSPSTIQVVRDDGSGAHKTSILLFGLGAVWSSSSFKGRVTVYGTSGTSVAVLQD